jgi:hypothetical protein
MNDGQNSATIVVTVLVTGFVCAVLDLKIRWAILLTAVVVGLVSAVRGLL